jgi:hypothetical protein
VPASELPESDDYQKPRKPRSAMTVRELRSIVSARHKYLCSTKPIDEAVALISDDYGADHDSSVLFCEWLRGSTGAEPPTKGALERIHVVTNPDTGEDTRIETEPGSIPPRPV